MPLAMLAAPTPATPVNAITVNDWCMPVADCVLDTVTLVSAAGAGALQISATPKCVFARARRGPRRPAPGDVSGCAVGGGRPPRGGDAPSTTPPAARRDTAAGRL